MADGAIGAILNIPKSLLDDIKKADEYVVKLGEDSEKAAKQVGKLLANMTPLAGSIREVKNELEVFDLSSLSSSVDTVKELARYTKEAATAASSIGKSYSGATNSLARAVTNVNTLSAKGVNIPGSGAIIVAHSEESRSRMILEQMSRYYQKIEEAQERASQRAQAASERQARKAERDREREAKAAERAAQREIKAAEDAEKKRIKALNESNYNAREAFRKSYQGSMYMAEGATSIDSRTRAIKYLTAARNDLSTTDDKYQQKLHALNEKIKELNKLNKEAIGDTNKLEQAHSGLFNTTEQLKRQFALLFSVSQIKGYVDKLVSIRGEFELQQRSLQAIIQNKSQADKIFNQTVALAVRSPFRVKELVSYTKQMAAYRIESDKLYDTTKRLADVSAGLGVDMQRLILAYGQVKAAAFLRATEVRQFTEAGINLYGELQKYFEEVKGEAYTTAQIVDMISKRKVTFEDIEQIFKRLTDQGGLFYNMQEIQAETLAGKISNLHDKLDLMLNEIGKGVFNEYLLKGAIDLTSTLLKKWEAVALVAKNIIAIILAIKAQRRISNMGDITGGIKLYIDTIKSAEVGTNKFGVAWKNLGASVKAGIVGLGIGVAITLATELFEKLTESGRRLKEINKGFAQELISINAISNAFNGYNLQYGENESKNKAVFEKQKEQLAKLSAELEKVGISIPVRLENVTQENINQVFYDAEKKLKTIKESVDYLQRQNAESSKGLKKGASKRVEELTEYTDEIVGSGLKIKEAINRLYADNFDLLDKNQREMLEKLSRGAQKGQSTMDYYVSALLGLREIVLNNPNLRSDGIFGNFFEDYLRELNIPFERASEVCIKLEKDWAGFLSSLRSAQPELFDAMNSTDQAVAENARGLFKTILKEFTSKEGYGAAATECFERFSTKWAQEIGINGLSFKIDTSDVAQQANWVDEYLESFFASKRYKLNIDDSDVTKAMPAVDKWLNERDERVKTAKKLIDFAESFKRGSEYTKAKDITVTDDILQFMGYTKDYQIKTISKKDFEERLKQLKEQSESGALSLGGILDKQEARKAEQRERDIWQERIDVLKKMHTQYESVSQYLSAKDASSFVKSTFAESMKEASVSSDIADAYVPTKEGLIEALKKVYAQMPDAIKKVKKGNDLKQEIDILEIGISQDNLKKDLDATKKEINGMFDSMNLRNKMKDLGLLDFQIDTLIPGLPSAKSFNEIESRIRNAYGVSKEMENNTAISLDELIGADNANAYREAMEKLNKQIADDKMNSVNELVKAYKDKLSEQLQIDLWYAKERAKIEENIQDPNAKRELRNNLDKQYQEKTDKTTWESFKDSDSYIRIFEDLEHVSTKTLGDMQARLAEMRSSLKSLDPSNLKEIVRLEQQIQDVLVDRNPFGALISGARDYFDYLKNRRELQMAEMASKVEEERLAVEYNNGESDNRDLQQEYNLMVEMYGAESQQAEAAKKVLDAHTESLNNLQLQRKSQADVTKSYSDAIREGEKAGSKTSKSLSKTREVVGNLGNKSKELAAIWDDDVADGIGKAINTFDAVAEGVQSVVSAIGITSTSIIATTAATSAAANAGIVTTSTTASTAIQTVEKGSVILAVISAALQIAIAIANMFNKDAAKEKQIQKQQEIIDKLKRSYENLKKSMDDAFDTSSLVEYNEQLKRNIDAQIVAREAQIALEKEKKKTDKSKITGYLNEIEDLKKSMKELEDDFSESLGGIGSKANYKQAAEDFAEAWFDAFNEGEDRIKALENSFNSLFDNLVTKQIMNRASTKFIEPLLDKINKAVDEDGAGGVDLVKSEIDEINAMKRDNLDAYNKYVTAMMEALGIDPRSSASLDALQQGIQGITERTAEAIESYLNSIRFFVSEQRNYVSDIYEVIKRNMDDSPVTSPILAELKMQTSLLSSMNGIFSDVAVYGNTRGGRGLKVYME